MLLFKQHPNFSRTRSYKLSEGKQKTTDAGIILVNMQYLDMFMYGVHVNVTVFGAAERFPYGAKRRAIPD